MLTRLRVGGFKNLFDVDVRFGPFTCVAGPQGLDQPLALPHASRVELTITPLDVSRGGDEFMDGLERLCDEQPVGSGGKRYTRDELHERR